MKKIMSLGIVLVSVLSACSSSQKARREERERLMHKKGVFCDFVSESDYNDVDVELNLRLAKKCDASKPFSIAGYKRVSENPGVLYCCNSEGFDDSAKPAAPVKGAEAPEAAKSEKSESAGKANGSGK